MPTFSDGYEGMQADILNNPLSVWMNDWVTYLLIIIIVEKWNIESEKWFNHKPNHFRQLSLLAWMEDGLTLDGWMEEDAA